MNGLMDFLMPQGSPTFGQAMGGPQPGLMGGFNPSALQFLQAFMGQPGGLPRGFATPSPDATSPFGVPLGMPMFTPRPPVPPVPPLGGGGTGGQTGQSGSPDRLGGK